VAKRVTLRRIESDDLCCDKEGKEPI